MFQIFSQIDILFSIGGKYYTGEPITYTYMEDKIFESSRNITIKLHHRVGKYVKLRLHFSDRWIMISEVTFDSGKPPCPSISKKKGKTIEACRVDVKILLILLPYHLSFEKKKKLARETRDMMYRAFLYRNISVVECRPIKQLPNLPTYRAQESPRYVVLAGVKTYRGIKTIAAERRERGKKALVTELVRKLNLEKKKFLLVTRNRFTGAQTFRR